jgi:hypothetical protein
MRRLLREIRARVAQAALSPLPPSTRLYIQRRGRGRRELRRLRRADVAVMAFAKSGRTWLRVMLSRLYQTKFGLPADEMLQFGNYHRMNAAIPVFLFAHGTYARIASRLPPPLTEFDHKKTIFLARHPCDIAVSYYFQSVHRTKPYRRDIVNLPPNIADMKLVDFVMSKDHGLPFIIGYLNEWAGTLARIEQGLLVRYEDMRQEPAAALRRIADFIGESFANEQIAEAVAFASFDRLKDMERADHFGSRRLSARDPSNPDSFKVRRGKIGGFRDYFTPAETAVMEEMVRTRLVPLFGYGESVSGILEAGSA